MFNNVETEMNQGRKKGDHSASVGIDKAYASSSLLETKHSKSTPKLEVTAMYEKMEEENKKFESGVSQMQKINIQQEEAIQIK